MSLTEQDLNQSLNSRYSAADVSVAVHAELRQGCTSQLCTTLVGLAVVLSCWAIRLTAKLMIQSL